MMTKEEQMIRELEGQRNPFLLPEGYFETFNERLAERLPQVQKPKTVSLMPRLWHYAAVALVVFGAGLALYVNRNSNLSTLAYNDEVSQEEYVNEALDYIMVDNMEIAEYLTEADY